MCLILTFHMQVQMPTILNKIFNGNKKYSSFHPKSRSLLYEGTVRKIEMLGLKMDVQSIYRCFEISFHKKSKLKVEIAVIPCKKRDLKNPWAQPFLELAYKN